MNDHLLRVALASAACVFAGAAVASAQKLPDLAIASLRATGGATLSGGNFVVPVTVRVENRGTTPAGAFEIGFFKPSEKAAGLETQLPATPKATVKGLAPGEGQDLAVQVTVAPASSAGRTVRLRARADTGKTVAESNETNNASALVDVVLPIISLGAIGGRAAVGGSVPAPGIPTVDLAISEDDIELLPAVPSTATPQFVMSGRIRNLGTGSSGDFSVAISLAHVGGRIVLQRTLPMRAISGHGEQRVPLTVYTRDTGAGDFLMRFHLIPSSPDLDPRNNTSGKSFHIAAPDVAVRAEEMTIDVTPDPRNPGCMIRWAVPVRNLGDAPAADVAVDWTILDERGHARASAGDFGSHPTFASIPVGGFQLHSSGLSLGDEGAFMLRITVSARGDGVVGNNQADKAFVARR